MHALRSKMRRRHHCAKRRLDRTPWIGEEVGDACECLLPLCVEDMQDRPDRERVARLLPVIAPFERALGSTNTSAMFWTSRTSHSPRRTSRSGL